MLINRKHMKRGALAQRDSSVKRNREKVTICKSRRETWNRSFLYDPQKEPTLLTS